MCTVRPAEGPEQVQAARALFREYAAGIGVDLGYQGFEDEVERLPGAYAAPAGRLLLAWCDGAMAGCVALRPLADVGCELKRLYVRPEFRGRGVGARLAERAIEEARLAGYRLLRLDTLPSMHAARTLYRQLGFREIPAYYDSAVAGTVFYERALDPPQ
jgi:putative acetyltransferase